jgi:hypothetical protein
MEIFWNPFFWIGIVAIIAIAAYTILRLRGAGPYKQLAERSEATQTLLLARLTEVESRLSAIEKTLNDIPQ